MSKKAVKKEAAVATEKSFNLILTPVITEKSMRGSEVSQVTFKVPLTATKPEIKSAVEALFKVKVKSVNTIRQSGKKKSRGIVKGVRSDFKKAVVTLADGHNIDVTTGI